MTVLLAGGGTGGHVFPLVAVADALAQLVPRERIVFVGTRRGIETRVVPDRGYSLELIDVLPLRGGGMMDMVKGVWRAAQCVPRAADLLRRYRPWAVFSVGGYAAGPLAVAARMRGIPLALLEPNAVVGLANALTAPLVDRAYTAFEEAEAVFPPSRVRRLGVPLREGFVRSPYAVSDAEQVVLVLGGSQGAKSLNEGVPGALAAVGRTLRVVHQCGPTHQAATRERYEALGLGPAAQVVPFIDDMPAALAAADLVVSRAGASAVSEICAVGRPSLLIPYPFAAGDHQRRNAEALQKAGAAVCVPALEASTTVLSSHFDRLLGDPTRLGSMAEAAANLGRSRAADAIARDLLQLGGQVLVGSGQGPVGVLTERGGSAERDQECG